MALPCHSQTLSMHSAVLCNMLKDLASQHNEKVKIPLADFTETQCSALIAYMNAHGVSGTGAAFESHDDAAHDAAAAVARFAHIYDVPHALRHVQVYLTAFMDARFKSKDCSGMSEMITPLFCSDGQSWPTSTTCKSCVATASGPW